MRVVMHRTELPEVLAIATVVIDGDHRVTSAVDRLGVVGDPPRPVVVDASLDLVRRGGASQEESVRQAPRRHPPAGGATRTRRRYPSDGSSTIRSTPFLRLHARTANACSAIGERTSSRPPGSSRAYAAAPARALPARCTAPPSRSGRARCSQSWGHHRLLSLVPADHRTRIRFKAGGTSPKAHPGGPASRASGGPLEPAHNARMPTPAAGSPRRHRRR